MHLLLFCADTCTDPTDLSRATPTVRNYTLVVLSYPGRLPLPRAALGRPSTGSATRTYCKHCYSSWVQRSSVGKALRATPEELAAAIIAVPEDQWFDRKSVREQPQGLAITEIAFANAEGGTIVVGVHDGRVEGTASLPEHRNALVQAAIDHTEPPIRITHRLVPCVNHRRERDELLVIEVEPSESVHTNRRDECYLRVGDEDRRLRFGQRQELIFDKGQAHFDGTALSEAQIADLDSALLARYCDVVGGTDIERVLQARLLMTRRSELTAGGYLLFGVQPQDRFPEAYVRVLRFEGTERQTGRRQNVVADVRCEGSIPAVITEAREAIARFEPARRVLGPGGRFVREGLIPTDAWLEGAVNAVIHRSYSLGGDHIRVEIFDNRIEIESPGRFPGVVGLEDPRGVARFARNPRIARVCADFQFGQEMGEGIRRMFDEMRTAGLADPIYQQRPGSVRLVLAATTMSQELAARLPSRSREVMELIRNAGGLSTGDVADVLGLSKPATLRRLHALRDAGLIDWVGKSSRDPRAFWRLHSE